jgi:LysR family transcriptional activator of nhaA
MRHLNYNHLLYFWTVAREGSVARAADVLHLTPQTISGQLKLLQESIGCELFQRVGRGLVLTDTGRLVEQYADEIFNLGSELSQRVKGQTPGAPVAFHVGIVNSIPKLIASRILAPALKTEEAIKMSCHENDLDSLLADLAVHKLDLVLSDRPIPSSMSVRAYNHELGSSALSFFGTPSLIEQFSKPFPEILDGAPVLLPTKGNALRRNLADWFENVGVLPRVVADFDDSALLKVFGEAGAGFFPAPQVMARQVESIYGVKHIGDVEDVFERFYLVSPERRIKHPAVVAITEAAKASLDSIQ